MKSSVLIPTYKRNNLLKYNLESIKTEDQIIILDQCQEEDQKLKQLISQISNKNIVYCHSGKSKYGFAKWRVPGFAYNTGAKIAKNEIIILCCPQMYHLNNTIKLLSQPFESNNKILSTPRQQYCKDDNGFFLHNINNLEKQKYFDSLGLLNNRLPFLMGINKEVYLTIGGYDQDFVGTDFDDNDIIDRLLLYGCKFAETDAKTVHLWHQRLPMTEQRMNMYNINLKLYNQRKGIIVRNKNGL